ncbi:MAG: hypothetical protein GXP31_16180 [Kiritimatiellaeota bacterium]|nr:hypothetical protein [Kiritimatiellota bacterium]
MQKTVLPVALGAFSLLLVPGGAARSGPLPAIALVAKPADSAPERRSRKQPTVPSNYKEVPFVETAPAPVLTAAEKARGYLLFERPIMEPVYPNTRPLAHERLEALRAFATPGEFEPVTFAVYPVRPLKNFRVRAGALRGPGGAVIPASALEVRLGTYWNIGFPRYTSRNTYRRVPELLERVTVHSSPAGECLRWWITIHVPEKAVPGVYTGAVTLWDDGFDRAVRIPVGLRVLDFTLKADPRKHYSAYYYARNRSQYRGKPEAWIQRTAENEYRAMRDFGLDVFPTQYLAWGDGKRLELAHPEDIPLLLKLGFRGPIPVAAGNPIGHLYRLTTPGAKVGSHWRLSKLPPPEFYSRITEMFRQFKDDAAKKGWPEFVFCPLDEVAASSRKYGQRVYKAVRDGGVRTYITKDPVAADAVDYRDVVDVWCSQPYSMPYEKIVSQKRYEYWCYPNHNAGEIKDRRVMCKGGRMTYGFGFWRSGYTMLIPWNWSWTPGPDQFDYLRGRRSGCGQRIDDKGEVIPAVYWECFREGRDDARYIYTLQQAAWERDGSGDPACRRAVADAKALLQRMWDDIRVQPKYLATGMWPSEEFNARRWKLALAIRELHKYPSRRQGDAPSVLVANTTPDGADAAMDSAAFIARAAKDGLLEEKDLGGDWSKWINVTGEGKLSITPDAGKDGKPGLRWEVVVDQKTDRGEGGKYPVGWPRIFRAFAEDELDMTRYDYLLFLIRVDSDRDEVADDTTPVGFTIQSNKFFEVARDLGGRQRVWVPVLFPVRDMIAQVGRGRAPWRSIRRVQFFIAERNYADGTRLIFDIAAAKLVRFNSPVVRDLAVPAFVLAPCSLLPVRVDLMGTRTVRPGTHRLTALLFDANKRPVLTQTRDLTAGGLFVLDTARVRPGPYSLEVTVRAAKGRVCSRARSTVEWLPDPL